METTNCLHNGISSIDLPAPIPHNDNKVSGPFNVLHSYRQGQLIIQSAVIVDHHEITRKAVAHLLLSDRLVAHVEEATHTQDALQICQATHPDLLITELDFEERDGIDLITAVRKRCPQVRILVLTARRSETRAVEAVQAGAHAVVLKFSKLEVFFAALKQGSHETFIDPSIDRARVLELVKRRGNTNLNGLTNREIQVVKLIAKGMRNRDIADCLSISTKTVQTHRLKLMQKLGAHNAVSVTRWAHEFDLT